MIRILYLPLNDLENAQTGMYRGFEELGLNWKIFDFYKDYLTHRDLAGVNLRFLEAVREFQPHLIHMQLQMTAVISADSIQRARQICPGVIITNWTGDIRQHADGSFLAMSQVCDHSLISNVGQIDLYKNAGGKNIAYWQVGISDNQIRPEHNGSSFEYDIIFTGSNYGQFPDSKLRYDTAMKLKSVYGARFGLFGSGYPNAHFLNPRDLSKTYAKSLTVLSISHFNNVSHYFSDRLVGCLASGRPTICWNFPGWDSYFVDGGDILMVKSVDEIINWVNHCKEHVGFANQVGHNGALKCFAEHSCAAKIIELINIAGLTHLL